MGLLHLFWCLQGAPQKVTIGLAHSTDGLEWTKVHGPGEGGCILERGAGASDWDHDFIMSPSLVQGADGIWQLHYFGGRMSTRWGSMHQRAGVQPGCTCCPDCLCGFAGIFCTFASCWRCPRAGWVPGCATAEHSPADGNEAWLALAQAKSVCLCSRAGIGQHLTDGAAAGAHTCERQQVCVL